MNIKDFKKWLAKFPNETKVVMLQVVQHEDYEDEWREVDFTGTEDSEYDYSESAKELSFGGVVKHD